MRIGELLGSTVLTATGDHLGHVTDVRLARNSSPQPLSGSDALQIDGLIVGNTSGGHRSGYGPTVNRPWLFSQILTKLRRDEHFVTWDDIAEIDGRIIRLRPKAVLQPTPSRV